MSYHLQDYWTLRLQCQQNIFPSLIITGPLKKRALFQNGTIQYVNVFFSPKDKLQRELDAANAERMRVAIQAAADKQLADAKQQVWLRHGVSSWATSTLTTWPYLVFCLASFFLSLAAQAAETLIYSLVTSKVDYCNSLIYGVPNQLIQKLLSVQKSAARPLTYTNKLEHIKPLLKQLHWLPVEFRNLYKILLMTFKC